MRFTILCFLALCSCEDHLGGVDQRCNINGTCSSPALMCQNHGGYSMCRPKQTSMPLRCAGEAECFCLSCNDNCADAGVKTCAFSDTSVWGSKPAVCECK